MILIIAGTNRPGSSTFKIATVLQAHYAAAGIESEIYSLTEMPPELFAPTSYAQKPEAWLAVQRRVLDAAGLHVITPEYNGSFAGVLKYFIDMLKFPESFEHKPVAFTGVASGIWGGLRAVEQLQMVFGYRNAHVYPDRVFIPALHTRLNDDGHLTDPAIDARLAKQATGFATYAHALAPSRRP
ncbi:MAG TPA: NAD(P)H-dependent oxidoreductase [Tepidisphaeraceae bacterium]|jgi:NAD(P)H-dependent FMN reductase